MGGAETVMTNRSRAVLVSILWMVLVALLPAPAQAQTVYFLVAERPGDEIHGDSYVLPLEDEHAIEHARDLITLGPEAVGDPIVVAAIEAGSDGINRDYLAPGYPEWSWHVTEFDSFAGGTIEILDGYPTLVESDVAWWIENTNLPGEPEVGYIGFWRYTVIAEITPIPEPSAIAACGMALMLCLRFFRKR
jgi:hypothetical protein